MPELRRTAGTVTAMNLLTPSARRLRVPVRCVYARLPAAVSARALCTLRSMMGQGVEAKTAGREGTVLQAWRMADEISYLISYAACGGTSGHEAAGGGALRVEDCSAAWAGGGGGLLLLLLLLLLQTRILILYTHVIFAHRAARRALQIATAFFCTLNAFRTSRSRRMPLAAYAARRAHSNLG